jgi:hypothetical protein
MQAQICVAPLDSSGDDTMSEKGHDGVVAGGMPAGAMECSAA